MPKYCVLGPSIFKLILQLQSDKPRRICKLVALLKNKIVIPVAVRSCFVIIVHSWEHLTFLCVWMTCISQTGLPEGGDNVLIIYILLNGVFVCFFMIPISIYLHQAVESEGLSTLTTLTSIGDEKCETYMLNRRVYYTLWHDTGFLWSHFKL